MDEFAVEGGGALNSGPPAHLPAPSSRPASPVRPAWAPHALPSATQPPAAWGDAGAAGYGQYAQSSDAWGRQGPWSSPGGGAASRQAWLADAPPLQQWRAQQQEIQVRCAAACHLCPL